jgi:hypothetical protein
MINNMKKYFIAAVLLCAPFVSSAYTIDANTSDGGIISPAGSILVAPGDSQFFNISAQDGFHLQDVSVDGASIGVTNSYTFDNVSADHNISVSAVGNLGGGLLYCSGPLAPGWNVSLPDGGCPVQPKPVYTPSFVVVEKDGSYTLRAGKLIQ